MELLIFISLIFCVWEMLLISIVEIMRLVICLKSAIFFPFFLLLIFSFTRAPDCGWKWRDGGLGGGGTSGGAGRGRVG